MSTSSPSTSPPTESELQATLGVSFNLWSDLRKFVEIQYGPAKFEWKLYRGGSGWTAKILLGKRNLFFMSPREGAFLVAFIFGDRAVEAAASFDLPPALLEELRSARKYAEGRGLRITVSTLEDLGPVQELIRLKLGF